ncbi:MAG: sulfite exporter TauE/SafE family protein [Leptospiraceae bacterium]|nr:sulfite exporter TauE/SafE family protein [Leptospiraceae bacterium]
MTVVVMIASEFWILLVAAFFISSISGAFGIGGGTLTVPFLIFIGSLPGWPGKEAGLAHTAVAISLLTALFLSLSASTSNIISRRIHFIPGLIVSSFSLPGSYLGVAISSSLGFNELALIFAFIVMITGFVGFFRKGKREEGQEAEDSRPRPTIGQILMYSISGFFVGVLSALTGLGGGVVLVPLFLWTLPGSKASEAVATSSFCIVFSAFYGSVLYAFQENMSPIPEPSLGHYYLPFAIPFAIGALLGGFSGAILKNKVQGLHLKRGFAIVQILAGLAVIARTLT